jgi:hypothetical protein
MIFTSKNICEKIVIFFYNIKKKLTGRTRTRAGYPLLSYFRVKGRSGLKLIINNCG